jgi:hypothetical protein
MSTRPYGPVFSELGGGTLLELVPRVQTSSMPSFGMDAGATQILRTVAGGRSQDPRRPTTSRPTIPRETSVTHAHPTTAGARAGGRPGPTPSCRSDPANGCARELRWLTLAVGTTRPGAPDVARDPGLSLEVIEPDGGPPQRGHREGRRVPPSGRKAPSGPRSGPTSRPVLRRACHFSPAPICRGSWGRLVR